MIKGFSTKEAKLIRVLDFAEIEKFITFTSPKINQSFLFPSKFKPITDKFVGKVFVNPANNESPEEI